MSRLFVAIDLPPALKLSLAKLCAGVSAARWVKPGNFHLTLRFIGEVDDPIGAEIASALGCVSATRFELTLAGVGQFGCHTLWAGVEHNPALIGLQTAVECQLRRIGFSADPRPFAPHVKLARLRRRRGLRAFLSDNKDFRAEPFEVSQFNLMESHLEPAGPTSVHKADYALREGSEPAEERPIDDRPGAT